MSPSPVNPPTVSIILPTFNGERFLHQSVQSCLEQSWASLEVIVIIDGSTDNTRSILSTFDDPRLRVVDRVDNHGLPESLNEGVRHAQGEFLTWTSDDNWFRPHAIASMLNALVNSPDADLVYASYEIADEDGSITRLVRADDPGTVWDRNTVGACFLYTRRLAETVGEYRPERRLIEDYDYWLRASMLFKFIPLHESLYVYRDHPHSLSGQINSFQRARAVARLKHEWRGISRKQVNAELAEIDIAEAFSRFRSGSNSGVSQLVLRGILGHPALVLNRGVISLGLQSLYRKLYSGKSACFH